MDQLEHTRRLFERLGAVVSSKGQMWTPKTIGLGIWFPVLEGGDRQAPIDHVELYVSLDHTLT